MLNPTQCCVDTEALCMIHIYMYEYCRFRVVLVVLLSRSEFVREKCSYFTQDRITEKDN